MRRIQVIDSHTGGEPTRVVVAGGPELGRGPMADRLAAFRDRFDEFRSCVVNEPRGSDVVVGALLCEPVDPAAAAGVIFFNNVGYLGMCGHGTIGLGATLSHMGRIGPGVHRVETPVGVVAMELEPDGSVAVENVVSRRDAKAVAIDVPGLRTYVGDVAWGGNWFFLVQDHGEAIEVGNAARLTEVASRIVRALAAAGIRGDDGGEIDHVELFGPPSSPTVADSRNFVLCPGLAYDRSPCGTGTSAKLACLFADGKLAEGRTWRQESVVGSVFEGSVRAVEGGVRPRIRGRAFITAESTLIVDPLDPFAAGIRVP